MYLGGGQIIQAPQTGEDVQIDPLDLAGVVVATRPADLAQPRCRDSLRCPFLIGLSAAVTPMALTRRSGTPSRRTGQLRREELADKSMRSRATAQVSSSGADNKNKNLHTPDP